MTKIDFIESRLSILKPSISFEEIIDEYLSEQYSEEEINTMDIVEFRRNTVNELNNRFSDIYNLDILKPENGFTILNIEDTENVKVRKYLHKFLVSKSNTGGEGASSDGSAELFEKISANAVKNYLGEGASIIMVGEGRQQLRVSVLKEITEKLNEKTGVYHDLPTRAKDDGVDFIIYKALDKRDIGNLIILGQATVGKHFNDKKPINDRWLKQYISFSVQPPTTLLSIVTYLESDKLRRVHSDFCYSIVFDRGRIIKYFDTTDENLNTEIIAFVKNITDEE